MIYKSSLRVFLCNYCLISHNKVSKQNVSPLIILLFYEHHYKINSGSMYTSGP